MKGKQRLSASVDAELLQAAQSAVEEGRADSISAWVNDALRLKAQHDRRMQALDSFLASYEAEHGVITETEIDEAVRRAQSRATVVRSTSSKKPARSRRGAA
jgi:Arc/MetJ-type ribon-helix-helix transcriptional regulator